MLLNKRQTKKQLNHWDREGVRDVSLILMKIGWHRQQGTMWFIVDSGRSQLENSISLRFSAGLIETNDSGEIIIFLFPRDSYTQHTNEMKATGISCRPLFL